MVNQRLLSQFTSRTRNRCTRLPMGDAPARQLPPSGLQEPCSVVPHLRLDAFRENQLLSSKKSQQFSKECTLPRQTQAPARPCRKRKGAWGYPRRNFEQGKNRASELRFFPSPTNTEASGVLPGIPGIQGHPLENKSPPRRPVDKTGDMRILGAIPGWCRCRADAARRLRLYPQELRREFPT